MTEFHHRFVPAERPGQPPLLLLHGTGGDENDLVSLGQMLAPGAALLSPRGQVLEQGMPRFFGRLAEGVFDPVEVRRRAGDLAAFIGTARERYGLPAPVAVGFSNGANVAAVILALHPHALAGGILLRPMLVLEDAAGPLDGRPVLMVSGAADPIITVDSADRLATLLRQGGADVEHRRIAASHGLVQQDVALARDWLKRFSTPGP